MWYAWVPGRTRPGGGQEGNRGRKSVSGPLDLRVGITSINIINMIGINLGVYNRKAQKNGFQGALRGPDYKA